MILYYKYEYFTYLLNGVGYTFVHSCTCVVGSYINIIYVYSQFKRILLINPPRASPYFTVNIVGDEWGGGCGGGALGKVISQHGFLFTPHPPVPHSLPLFVVPNSRDRLSHVI